MQQQVKPLDNTDAYYDFPDYIGPTRFVFICSSPRCGSTLLCAHLREIQQCGYPMEYFGIHLWPLSERWGVFPGELSDSDRRKHLNTYFDQYVDALIKHRTSPNGICSIKAHFSQVSGFFSHPKMKFILQHSTFLWIRRKEIIRQAISKARAMKEQTWRSLDQPQCQIDAKDYDVELIEKALSDIQADNQGWEKFFALHADIPVLHLYYEDLCLYPLETIKQVASFAGFDIPADYKETGNPGNMKKQGNHVNEIWLQKFVSESRVF